MEIIKNSDFENIYYFDAFEKEWRNIFKNDSENEITYNKWLYNRLSMLDENSKLVSNNVKSFEKVSNSNPTIYSIHSRSKKNPRVLYYLTTEDNKTILLTAFVERKKSDYRLAVSRAESRIKQYFYSKEEI